MSDIIIDRPELDSLGVYEFGWSDSDAAGTNARRGINTEVVADISGKKSEPDWMLERRMRGDLPDGWLDSPYLDAAGAACVREAELSVSGG